ncbi:hypothetical protein GALMADRAFT_1366442 [Galerina marginata CBS 339.88]|uniref:Uncharacterized protein n=1 Tax=Galerina marginata (strain CBS 339.88) TaxID=685588 RepID=A0A067T4E0_GALM3|nr:hypothetical protein GALMADRAFT_1366442 [Galerina marginata CBS 339.88]
MRMTLVLIRDFNCFSLYKLLQTLFTSEEASIKNLSKLQNHDLTLRVVERAASA